MWIYISAIPGVPLVHELRSCHLPCRFRKSTLLPLRMIFERQVHASPGRPALALGATRPKLWMADWAGSH
jgi:hypothetical protein